MDSRHSSHIGLDIRRLFLVVDMTTGVVLDVDHRLMATTGWTSNEIFGKNWIEFIHPSDLEHVLGATEFAAESGSCRWLCRILHADGSWISYQCEGTLGADGLSYYVSAHDAVSGATQDQDSWQWARFGELATDLFVVSDVRGRVVAVNAAVERLHGVKHDDVIGQSVLQFIPPDSIALLAEVHEAARGTETQVRQLIPAIDAHGNEVLLDCSFTFDPRTQRWYTIERDVTEQVAREKELQIAQRFFDLSRSQLALINHECEILRSNPAFNDFTGLSSEESADANLLAALGVGGSSDLAEAIGLIETGSSRETLVAAVKGNARFTGEDRVLSVTLMASADGESIFFSSRDVTEEQRLAAELYDRATHDPLTRLASRDVFTDALQGDLDAGFGMSVMMIDLDEFKRINDSLGHAAGDDLLQQIGDRLQRTSRADDVIARFGGDEFVVLMRGVTSTESAREVAEKVRASVAEPYYLSGRKVHITASIGVSIGGRESHTPSLLLQQADSAAYDAKRTGRDQVRLFDRRLQQHLKHEELMEHELRSAIATGRVTADVQGVFTLDGRLAGVEVLRRIVTRDGQRITPQEYQTVARKLGLTVLLGEIHLDHVLRTARPWLEANPEIVLGLNVDPHEILTPGYGPAMLHALKRHQIEPRQLIIEVTEGGFAHGDGQHTDVVELLRKAGIRIAIDDFGTGASSLGFLRDLHLDAVKIAPSFGTTISTDPVARAITSSVVHLGCDLGLNIMVSGVESDATLKILRELDQRIDVQGDLLHQAEPMEEFFARPIDELSSDL